MTEPTRWRVRVEFDADQLDVRDVWESILKVLHERVGVDELQAANPYAICERIDAAPAAIPFQEV